MAEQITVVAPTGNSDPEGGKQLTVTLPSTISTALAVYLTTAPLLPIAPILPGSVRTGRVVSTTVTVKLPEPVFVLKSVAVHVTVVVPSGNVVVTGNDVVFAGTEHVGATFGSALSVAEAEYVKEAPLALVASFVTL